MTTKTKSYKVAAAFVNVRVAGQIVPYGKGGYTQLGFYKGSLLPPGAHSDDVNRLLKGGYIEEVEADA